MNREEGFSLPELLITLPMLIMLGMALLSVFGIGSKYYRDFLGNWELVQQVRYPMEEIAKDIRYCNAIELHDDGDSKYLRIKRYSSGNLDDPLRMYWQEYKFTKRKDRDYWIQKNTQPVLGKTALTDIQLDLCECELLGENKVRVLISGINRSTGHKFKLERVFYSYACGKIPVR